MSITKVALSNSTVPLIRDDKGPLFGLMGADSIKSEVISDF